MKELKLGGQAVIEGVMVKSKKSLAIAVRKPNGRIKVKREKLNPLSERYSFFGWLFVRGVVNLFEMLVIGIKAMNFSADEAAEEEDEKLGFWTIFITLVLAVALALFIFKFIPLLITQLFSKVLAVVNNRFVFNFTEGFLKVLIFVVYIYVISFMKDIRRIFQYHGAEHMTIACFEDGKKVKYENIRKYPTEHVRCGTSFIALVIIISILVYTFLPTNITFLNKLFWRIMLLPVIAGISYEVLKISHKFEKMAVFNLFIKPGLWIQKLTTAKPDKKQIEVAKASLEAVVSMEGYKE